ncbi:MAG: hypothetical protein OXM88_07765 [bacterium]|nr:hypothetical protein [bacterium]
MEVDITRSSLIVTLDKPGTDESGVLVEDFQPVLEGVTRAVQLMVSHLGGRSPGPGRVPDWVRDQSRLRITAIRMGSMALGLTLDPPPDRAAQLTLESYGEQAVQALCDWDGREDSTLPPVVTDCLWGAASGLSDGWQMWLGSESEPRRIEIKRRDTDGTVPVKVEEEALLQGWLKEVNWAKGTAQLHSYTGSYVRLEFDSSLEEEMLRSATRYVEVEGTGLFSDEGDCKKVTVSDLNNDRSWGEPFDMDAFLNAHDAKVFHPDEKLTIDLTDEEWERFNQAIREGREV